MLVDVRYVLFRTGKSGSICSESYFIRVKRAFIRKRSAIHGESHAVSTPPPVGRNGLMRTS